MCEITFWVKRPGKPWTRATLAVYLELEIRMMRDPSTIEGWKIASMATYVSG